eukprot:scaffold1294_cov167-Amphora_coffeaeformis.AAC.16
MEHIMQAVSARRLTRERWGCSKSRPRFTGEDPTCIRPAFDAKGTLVLTLPSVSAFLALLFNDKRERDTSQRNGWRSTVNKVDRACSGGVGVGGERPPRPHGSNAIIKTDEGTAKSSSLFFDARRLTQGKRNDASNPGWPSVALTVTTGSFDTQKTRTHDSRSSN